MAASSPWIVETTTDRFETDVIERSQQVPVVIDFWATWCGPCRQLTPILEDLANEYAGQFILVKVNVDEAQPIAAAFGIQSIPFVVGIKNGEPVNHFQGVVPEAQLREWLNSIVPSPAEELVQAGEQVESDDPSSAEAKYREALELVPKDDSIKIRLARVLLAQQQEEEARHIIEELEARGFLEPEAERIKSQLELLTAAEEVGGVEEARSAADAHPEDLSLQLKLADALAVSGQHEEALEICLRLIEQDKSGIGVDAKQTMLKIFDLLGPQSELVSTYRRRLTTLLY